MEDLTISKLFVPYKESMELKKLGFDEPCFAYYDEEDSSQTVYEYANCDGNVTGNKSCYNYDFLSVTNSQLDEYGAFGAKDDEGEECFSRWTAPTFSQAFRWFREKYNLRGFIGFRPNTKQFDCHVYDMSLSGIEYVKQRTLEQFNKDPKVGTYEEAELACLKKLIEIVKKKQE